MKQPESGIKNSKAGSFLLVLMTGGLISGSHCALAQTLPSTGTLLKQIESVKPMTDRTSEPAALTVRPENTDKTIEKSNDLKITGSRVIFIPESVSHTPSRPAAARFSS